MEPVKAIAGAVAGSGARDRARVRDVTGINASIGAIISAGICFCHRGSHSCSLCLGVSELGIGFCAEVNDCTTGVNTGPEVGVSDGTERTVSDDTRAGAVMSAGKRDGKTDGTVTGTSGSYCSSLGGLAITTMIFEHSLVTIASAELGLIFVSTPWELGQPNF